MSTFMTPRGDAVLAAMDDIATQTGATLTEIALAWNAAQPGVTAPIASTTSVAQLKELMGSLSVTLSPAHLQALGAAAATPNPDA